MMNYKQVEVPIELAPMINSLIFRLETEKKLKKEKKLSLDENLEELKNSVISLIRVVEEHKNSEILKEIIMTVEMLYNMSLNLSEYRMEIEKLNVKESNSV